MTWTVDPSATDRLCIKPLATDLTRCEAVRRLLLRCRRAINQRSVCVEIDLRDVESADSKLVASLVALYQTARATSVRVELLVSPAVRDALRFCRLEPLIDRTRPDRLVLADDPGDPEDGSSQD